MRSLCTALVLLCALAGAAFAQDFAGSYATRTEAGEIALKLAPGADGKLAGTFSFLGTTLRVTATAADGKLSGIGVLEGEPIRFQIRGTRADRQLTLEVTEIDPEGKPDARTTERFVFPATAAPAARTPDPKPAAKPQAAANPPAKQPNGAAAPAKANPLAARRDPLVGTFQNDEMTVVVRANGAQYGGSITLGGESYPFTAKRVGQGLTGTFKSGGDPFEFTAELAGNALKLTSGGTEHALVRQGAPAGTAPGEQSQKPANPLAGRPGGTAANGQRSVKVRLVEWKVLRHPVGLAIRYPASWSSKPVPGGGFQLIPPEPAVDGGQPAEAYFILGAQAGQLAQADDPQLVQLLDAQVRQLAPFLQREAEPKPVKAADTTGVLLAWQGTNPAGKEIQARIYATLIKGFALCVFELGYKQNIAKRDKEVQAIFATLGASQEAHDPRAAGNWGWVGSGSMSAQHSMQKTQSASSSSGVMALQADGSAMRRETSQTIVGSNFNNSGGQSTGSLFLDTGPQVTTKKGRWYAGDGRLVLLWDDDTAEEYNYQVQGADGARRLTLTSDKGGVDNWQERGG